MNMEITVFAFRGQNVRTVIKDGEPWFVAKDVCEVLELTNPTEVVRGLDEDEKMTLNNLEGHSGQRGGAQFLNVVNESGLYALIFKSRKPEAKAFRKWVTSEVLPTLRRSGGYIAARAEETPEEILARALIVAKETIDRVSRKNQKLREENESMKPKALFADAVSSSQTSILVGELAKLLRQNGIDIGQNRLFAWLRENGWLIMREGGDYNMPTQKGMDADLFEIKESAISNPDGSVRIVKTTKVTGKGQVYFVNKFLQVQQVA